MLVGARRLIAMEEKKDELLAEFTELIKTVGTEVSPKISAQVSTEVASHLMTETIFPSLQKLQKEIVQMLQEMPRMNETVMQNVSSMTSLNAEHARQMRDQKKFVLSTQAAQQALLDHLQQEYQVWEQSMDRYQEGICQNLEIRNHALMQRLEKLEQQVDRLTITINRMESNMRSQE